MDEYRQHSKRVGMERPKGIEKPATTVDLRTYRGLYWMGRRSDVSDLSSVLSEIPMMTKRMWDAISPNAGPATWEVAAGYIPGGDAFHGWTDSEWRSERARYRLPIFVRSNPNDAAQGHTEGLVTLAWCNRHAQPKGTTVALDLETAINRAYVNAFSTTVLNGGYQTVAYGSLSSLYSNPKPSGGFWSAHWTGTPHIEQGSVATQYANPGAYDSSLILDTVPLWDTHAAPIPSKEVAMASGELKVGKGAENVGVFPAGSAHGVLLGADNGVQGLPPTIVRVAAHDKNGWHVGSLVTVDGAKGTHAVAFADPATTTLVSFVREDASFVNVGWSTY
jgi:hypothetical protein